MPSSHHYNYAEIIFNGVKFPVTNVQYKDRPSFHEIPKPTTRYERIRKGLEQ